MKIIAPAYFNRFACIAARCRHSCCVGWEVDIDEESLVRYSEMSHPYAEKIRASIEGETPHFKLLEGERCPHLDASGLCKIITECGDTALCQICRDHPRYRNFYDGVVEIGLGLSCEEAVRNALSADTGFIASDSEDMTDATYFSEYPAELFSEEERPLANEKKRLVALAKNHSLTIENRIDALLPKRPGFKEIKELYLSMEILDTEWKSRLNLISAENFGCNLDKNADLIEQMLCAFIYRHVSCESFYLPRTVAAFAALSALVVSALSRENDDFADTLRAYSAEIEYSTENTERVLDFLEELT